MPPKAKFTRDDIILAAMQIVQEQGPEAVTSRELGKKLGSSACPVFTAFKNMEEVNEEVKKSAKALYKEYVKEGLKQELAFKGVGSAYIKFAIKEPKLFQLLFMKEKVEPTDIEHTLKSIDENYEDILKSVQEPYGLQLEDAKKLYQHLWIYTHGIATLCATKVCIFSGEEIQTMITEVFMSIFEKMKGSKANDTNREHS
ncbi:MAG TPA: WHG domain-containing protein [Lachnospiraceae bacterium]|nr:WHG domain-containing protein [Lachnospiraceae bacterium]